jgi:plastocyanin
MTQVVSITLVAIALAPMQVSAGPVSGVVRTITRDGTAAATSVVYAEPLDAPAPRRPGTYALGQKDKTFQPHVVAIPVGSTVDFPNNDDIFHNVFSLSGPQPFDLGLYRSRASRSRTFAEAGTYRVFCNIHPQMTALIVVVPTPHVTVAGPDGRFVLELPPGRYRLTVLSERASPVTADITSGPGASSAPDLTLDESAWVAAKHKNKYGQEYPAAAYKK